VTRPTYRALRGDGIDEGDRCLDGLAGDRVVVDDDSAVRTKGGREIPQTPRLGRIDDELNIGPAKRLQASLIGLPESGTFRQEKTIAIGERAGGH
jgi:hypothetical protein